MQTVTVDAKTFEKVLSKLPKAIQKKANRQFITLLTKLPPSLTKNQKNG